MSDPASRIQEFFAEYCKTIGSGGPIGEAVERLASGHIDPGLFGDLNAKHGIAREHWFRAGALDLVLAFISHLLVGGKLSADDVVAIRLLKTALHVREGDFIAHRPAETAEILESQLEEILADNRIEEAEDLYMVELQAAFDLSYDEYLQLVRRPLANAIATLRPSEAHAAPPEATSADSNSPPRYLDALTEMYRLASSTRRSLGARF